MKHPGRIFYTENVLIPMPRDHEGHDYKDVLRQMASRLFSLKKSNLADVISLTKLKI